MHRIPGVTAKGTDRIASERGIFIDVLLENGLLWVIITELVDDGDLAAGEHSPIRGLAGRIDVGLVADTMA